MDYRKRILKKGNGYVDWFGRLATETQYLDYMSQIGEKDVYVVSPETVKKAPPGEMYPEVIEQADKLTIRYELDTPSVTEEDWLYVRITETDIPNKAQLLNHLGQHSSLGNLPGTQKGLQKVPGIGPVAAGKIAQWMEDNWGVNIP